MNTSPQTVAFVSPGWPPEKTPSGIATYVKNISDGLAAHGVGSRILSIAGVAAGTESGNVTDLSEIDRLGRTIWNRIGDRIRGSFGRDPGAARHLGRAISRSLSTGPRPMLVELEESFGIARWVRSRNVPCVVRLHGPWFINGPMYGETDPAEFRRRCDNEFLGIESAAGVTAPSRVVMEQTLAQLRRPPRHAAIIPNPVAMPESATRWNASAATARKILYVGRFERIKGPDVILAAFSRVIEKAPDAQLTFVGPDNGFQDDAGRTWSIDEYLGAHFPPPVRSRIRYLGALPRAAIEKLRVESSVAVVASRQESFSLALVESMAAGTPTIASNVGGMVEIIEDGKTGLMFRSAQPDHLAAQILSVFENPLLAESLSVAGIARSRQFTPVEVARQTLDFYRAVTA